MILFCTAKVGAHEVERPEHTRGFLLIHCVRCGRTTDHAPRSQPGARGNLSFPNPPADTMPLPAVISALIFFAIVIVGLWGNHNVN